MARTIGDQVLAIHANTLISDVNGVDEHVAATLVTERLLSTLATAFAVLALGLAAVNLYGMLSYAVAQRRAEFGVRMALGATSSRVATGLVAELLPLVAVGLATGLPLSYFVARAAGSLLFGVTPFESAPYLVSAVVVAKLRLKPPSREPVSTGLRFATSCAAAQAAAPKTAPKASETCFISAHPGLWRCLGAVAGAAAWLPARRAGAIDPAEALRGPA
jgi:ABC-type antimicrobial peptide transport system permease subunit